MFGSHTTMCLTPFLCYRTTTFLQDYTDITLTPSSTTRSPAPLLDIFQCISYNDGTLKISVFYVLLVTAPAWLAGLLIVLSPLMLVCE